MLPMASKDLGKATIRRGNTSSCTNTRLLSVEISMRSFKGAAFWVFGFMVLEWGVDLVQERGRMVSILLKVKHVCGTLAFASVTVSICADAIFIR